MIIHLVFWKLKDEAEGATAADNAQRICEKLRALKGTVPQIVDLHCGPDFNRSPTAFDVALYSTFASREDLQGYIDHPAHQAAAAFIRSVIKDRAVVDYEL